MDFEKVFNKVKYDIEFIFSFGVNVINVRFYEDDRPFKLYVNEFEEEFVYFSKPTWRDSDYQIIEEVPRKRYTILVDGKVYNTYRGSGGIRKLLGDLNIIDGAFDHSDEVYEGGIFSGIRESPKRKKPPRNFASKVNMKGFKKDYDEGLIREGSWNTKYNLSNNAIIAFLEGKVPGEDIPPEWLDEIGWEGTLEELLEASFVKDFYIRQEWHHMVLDRGDGLKPYDVNFYDPKSLERLVSTFNEGRSYKKEKREIETLEDVLSFGEHWWDWKTYEKHRITYIYSGNNLVFLVFEEGNGYYTVRDTYWGEQDTSIEKVRKEEVINWILDLIDKLELERNEEI